MEKTIKWILWVAAILLLVLLAWRFVVVKNAEASFTHRDWSGSKYTEWSACETELQCGGVVEGTQSREKYRVCEFELWGTDHCTLNEKQVLETQYQACKVELPVCEPEYPAEGLCPTACGKLADYVDDGQGGQKYCSATPLCNNAASAPQCPNGVPATPPANAHVVRNGSSATVNAHIPEGDRANIYYKENGADGWKHAVRDIVVSGKYLSYTINDLVPALGYTFAVQASSGCAGGELVSVVVDPPANGKTFMFSYFDWMD